MLHKRVERPEDWEDRVRTAARLVSGRDLWVRATNVTAEDIRSELGSMSKRPAFVAVDYVQALTASNPREPRESQVRQSVQVLKQTALQLQIPVLTIASYNREAAKGRQPPGRLRIAPRSARICSAVTFVALTERSRARSVLAVAARRPCQSSGRSTRLWIMPSVTPE